MTKLFFVKEDSALDCIPFPLNTISPLVVPSSIYTYAVFTLDGDLAKRFGLDGSRLTYYDLTSSFFLLDDKILMDRFLLIGSYLSSAAFSLPSCDIFTGNAGSWILKVCEGEEPGRCLGELLSLLILIDL